MCHLYKGHVGPPAPPLTWYLYTQTYMGGIYVIPPPLPSLRKMFLEYQVMKWGVRGVDPRSKCPFYPSQRVFSTFSPLPGLWRCKHKESPPAPPWVGLTFPPGDTQLPVLLAPSEETAAS